MRSSVSHTLRKSAAALLILCLAAALWPAGFSAHAGTVLTETVNLLNVKKNQSGEGYYWHNPSNTLTLTNLNIDTDKDFGLRLLAGSTVVLKGDNRISAAKTAIECVGTVTFKGDGSLTLDAGENGIWLRSEKAGDKLMILSGTVKITVGENALRSDRGPMSISGGTFELSAARPDGHAVNGFEVTIKNAAITADNVINALYKLELNSSNLTVNAPRSALSCPNGVSISNMSLSAGASPSALSKTDAYNGEASLKAVSTYKKFASSVVFGSKYPLALDFVALAAAIAAIAAVVILPPYIKRRRLR